MSIFEWDFFVFHDWLSWSSLPSFFAACLSFSHSFFLLNTLLSAYYNGRYFYAFCTYIQRQGPCPQATIWWLFSDFSDGYFLKIIHLSDRPTFGACQWPISEISHSVLSFSASEPIDAHETWIYFSFSNLSPEFQLYIFTWTFQLIS